jgi:hypothetical protein
LPVEAVFALHIANGVDEEDEKGRIGQRPIIFVGYSGMAGYAFDRIHMIY